VGVVASWGLYELLFYPIMYRDENTFYSGDFAEIDICEYL